MTNLQIITGACIANGLYTEEHALELLEQFGELPVHTFKAWKERGYSVKKGQHATLKVEIWRHKDRRQDQEPEQEQDQEQERLERPGDFYKKVCHLFTFEQVEPIKARV